jgi:5-hydroxyisourate hydrolase
MSSLSTHVLDTERGTSAAGVGAALFHAGRLLAQAQTDDDGRITDVAGVALAPGTYALVFEVGAYFQAHGRTTPFLERVSVEFRVGASDSHVHLPLLLSPYACTTYRGS